MENVYYGKRMKKKEKERNKERDIEIFLEALKLSSSIDLAE